MKARMEHLAKIGGICVISFVFACYAVAGDAPAGIKKLSTAAHKAKAEFRPLAKPDVKQAEKSLCKALDRLDERLSQAGENGEDWRNFLEFALLNKQVRRDAGPDRAVLGKIYGHYTSGHEGLDLVWFLDVQKALRDYSVMLQAVDSAAKVRKEFEKQVDKLAKGLNEFAAKPTTDNSLEISEAVRWLENARQTPRLVKAVQNRFDRPNVMGFVSADVIAAGIAAPVDDTTPVSDCILGTDVFGTAHTIGRTDVKLSPNKKAGIIDAMFRGTTTSENVGYHGPVTIFSNSTTKLAGKKRIYIDADGLSSYPGESNAETSVDISDIQSNKGRAFVEKFAWKRAAKQKALAEAIASSHAEDRLNERLDEQADEALEKANQGYVEKFKRPFTERKLFPQELTFSSTKRTVNVVALQAGGGKLAAASKPPKAADGADMSLRIHESAINNLAFDALAGRTIYEEKMQEAVTDALGHLPEKMKGDDDGKPWAITFAPRQPVSVSFADDGLKIAIHGVRFCKGSDVHPGMNVSASYKIEKTAKGFKAIRQGEIEVFPPDFKPGKDQLDARRQVIRTLLIKRFGKVFEKEILGEGFEFTGKLAAAGKLQPIQVVARDGWLVISWKRQPAEKAEKKVASNN